MILRTTSQFRSRSTALLVGEPLAKPDTRCGLPRPLLQGEVAMRSIDGEVVSKLRLEKKKRTAKLCSAKFMLHALLEEISANEGQGPHVHAKKTCVFRRACPVCQWLPLRGSWLHSRRRGISPKNGRTSSRKRLIYDAGFRVNRAAVPTIQVHPPSSKSLNRLYHISTQNARTVGKPQKTA